MSLWESLGQVAKPERGDRGWGEDGQWLGKVQGARKRRDSPGGGGAGASVAGAVGGTLLLLLLLLLSGDWAVGVPGVLGA